MQEAAIVVVGSSNTDMMVRAPHLPLPGETIIGDELLISPGGKGANQAVAAARLGARTHLVARIGTDFFGEHTQEILANFGVDLSFVVRDSETASGVALITVDAGGQNSIVVAPGTNFRLSPEDVDAARSALAEAHLVLCQNEVMPQVNARMLALMKELGRPVLLNPAPVTAAGLPDAWYADITLLVPNQIEAGLLLGRTVGSQAEATAAGHEFVRRGVQVAVITLGSQGAVAVTRDNTYYMPALPLKAVDTTAAGDCFIGALAFALASGKPLSRAMQYASGAAALAVTRPGAQRSLPFAPEVDALMEENAWFTCAMGTEGHDWSLSL